MSRNMTAALSTALDASSVKPVFFAYFGFDGGAVRFWSGSGSKVLSGYSAANLDGTYTGLGDLGALSLPPEASDGSSSGAVFTLSGIPSTTTSLALNENYQNYPCALWLGALDGAEAVIADPYQMFSGLMDVLEMNDDGQSASVQLKAEGFAYGVGPSNRRYTDVDQNRAFSGDRGLEFVAGLQDKQIVWGAQAPVDKPPPDEDEYYDEWDDGYDG